jgi:DNA methyltransferase 1-associated protein 1
MTRELKQMFESDMTEPSAFEIQEKQRVEQEAQRKKEYIKKQTGMKREIIKLVGGLPGVVPTGPSKQMAREDHVQRWVWSNFKNPARVDGLRLSHWQRKEDVDKDYEYAQFNKKIQTVDFSDEEYNSHLKELDPGWTLEETKYLWELCKQFDLRFIVIHDRYEFPCSGQTNSQRTIEELKDRYYSVSRKLLEVRKNFDHPILKSGYNYEQEMKRRACLEKIINRTTEENNQEMEILKQAEEVENKIQKLEKTENNLKNLATMEMTGDLNYPGQTTQKQSQTFEDYIEQHANSNDSYVYLRSQKLKHPLPISDKIQKKVDLLLKELIIPDKLTPTVRVEQAYDILRNNLVILTSLRKHFDKKDKELERLNKTMFEVQNKITTNMPLPRGGASAMNSSTIVTLPNAMPDSDIMSISSRDRNNKKIGNNNSNSKARKRKSNDDSMDNSSATKKRKKINPNGGK